MQDIFSHDKNNENLIQDVYKELVDLGWFNNLEKKEVEEINFGELDHPDNDDTLRYFTSKIKANSKIPSKYFDIIDDSNLQGALGERGNVGITSTYLQQIGRVHRDSSIKPTVYTFEIKGLDDDAEYR